MQQLIEVVSATVLAKAMGCYSSQIPSKVLNGILPQPNVKKSSTKNYSGYAWSLDALQQHCPDIAKKLENLSRAA